MRTEDQMPSAPTSVRRDLLPPRHAAAPHDDDQPFGMLVTSSNSPAEPQLDIGMVVDLRLQRGLQVGAMHHPIG